MSKVTNKKENYRTRSSLSNKNLQAPKNVMTNRESSSDFSVDINGYFIWNSSLPQKKYNK
jgi:hypothetical protein